MPKLKSFAGASQAASASLKESRRDINFSPQKLSIEGVQAQRMRSNTACRTSYPAQARARRVLGAVCWTLACAHRAGACQLILTAGRKPSTFITSAKLRATPRRIVSSRRPPLQCTIDDYDAKTGLRAAAFPVQDHACHEYACISVVWNSLGS